MFILFFELCNSSVSNSKMSEEEHARPEKRRYVNHEEDTKYHTCAFIVLIDELTSQALKVKSKN